jgi:hypothetical protein
MAPGTLLSKASDAGSQTCPACSLMEVVHYRFEVFRSKFGRDPLPNEPLFFDPEAAVPIQASPLQVHTQLADACRVTGVGFTALTNFWNLAEDQV